MRSSEAKMLLDKQINATATLRDKLDDWGTFNTWKRETKIIIARIFGDRSPHLATFDGISYSPGVFVLGGGRDYEEDHRYWRKGFDEAAAFLRILKDEVDRDSRFGRFRTRCFATEAAAEVDTDGKITLHWLVRRLPARFIFIALSALAAAFLLGVRAGQIDWIQKLFGK